MTNQKDKIHQKELQDLQSIISKPLAKDFTVIKVLLVEDNPTAAAYLRKLLMPFNSKVTWAEDGETAFAMVEEERFDLIITDFGLPGFSGDELVKKIRTFEKE